MFVYNNLQIMPNIVNSDCKLKVTYYTGNKKGVARNAERATPKEKYKLKRLSYSSCQTVLPEQVVPDLAL